MRIMVDIGHPGHVHFYKHAIREWQQRGHEVMITARRKDVALALLDHYGFEYALLTEKRQGRFGLLHEFIEREWKLLRYVRKFRPDVITAIGGVFIAPVGRLIGVPTVVFTDTEHVAQDKYLTYPLASAVVTPDCFAIDAGPRQIRYRGFHELAYLHPARFQPDPAVLSTLGIQSGERYALVRLIGWDAAHDLGHSGFTSEQKQHLVYNLSQFGKVFISVEGDAPPEIQPYVLRIRPELVHDVLWFASLYIGEGATMATEAGILGTPSIYTSSLVGTMGNFVELKDRYELVFSYCEPVDALGKSVELLREPTTKHTWQQRRERLLAEKIDVTPFVVEIVEQYGHAVKHT